jgi:hypothetical protein
MASQLQYQQRPIYPPPPWSQQPPISTPSHVQQYSHWPPSQQQVDPSPPWPQQQADAPQTNIAIQQQLNALSALIARNSMPPPPPSHYHAAPSPPPVVPRSLPVLISGVPPPPPPPVHDPKSWENVDSAVTYRRDSTRASRQRSRSRSLPRHGYQDEAQQNPSVTAKRSGAVTSSL